MEKRQLIDALQYEGADLVLEYGSSISSSADPDDIDLFAVGLALPERSHFHLAEYDVIRLTWEEFNRYLKHLDPVYCTEAILKGQILVDVADQLESLREQIQGTSPSFRAVRHNVNQAVTHLLRTEQQPKPGVIEALQFASSYWIFAEWYSRGREPVLLNELIEKTCLPEATRELLSADPSGKRVEAETGISIRRAYEGFLELALGRGNYPEEGDRDGHQS